MICMTLEFSSSSQFAGAAGCDDAVVFGCSFILFLHLSILQPSCMICMTLEFSSSSQFAGAAGCDDAVVFGCSSGLGFGHLGDSSAGALKIIHIIYLRRLYRLRVAAPGSYGLLFN